MSRRRYDDIVATMSCLTTFSARHFAAYESPFADILPCYDAYVLFLPVELRYAVGDFVIRYAAALSLLPRARDGWSSS